MFDSLDDEIRRDEAAVSSPLSRWLRYLGVLALAILLFSGLYAGIRFLE